jgi:hypothetical protein
MARARQAGHPRLDDLPLFADDLVLGAALLGEARASEWPNLVPMYERRGFPKVDPVMGGVTFQRSGRFSMVSTVSTARG